MNKKEESSDKTISDAEDMKDNIPEHRIDEEKRRGRNDMRLLLFLLLICGLIFAGRELWAHFHADGDGKQVVVSLDGEPVLICGLNELRDMETEEELRAASKVYDEDILSFSEEGVEVRSEVGYNVISYGELSDGSEGVKCLRADCPDKVCVEQGTICLSTEVIVCLPHKLTVRIED